ncbi:glycosyltransferase involved in cell wall biosynthesis [Hydrogenispora ethanolica]|uniref:Glycosyltransferase involved in cell wall biosynthesis n=1 Tax=Hydrogenispora ethanolica TaxID=1082276 RepID=A0A4R1RFI5_HYDET|nr:glycosyltransferase [Hydrogenispora ethanolica]TCL64738.1 glycosyltransferase involved in cell wall biosynthesis [Hydrogenispora ethanolica]
MLDYSIICLSSIDWNFMHQRPQQIMKLLSKKHPILYIEPTKTWEGCLRKQGIGGFKTLRKINSNLFVLNPIIPFSARKFPYINNKINNEFHKNLQKTVFDLGFNNNILWFYTYNQNDLIGLFKEKYIIYDCVDDHAQFNPQKAKIVSTKEDYLLSKADHVFVTAENLYNKVVKKNKKVTINRNGVDVSHFMVPLNPEKKEKKVVGFIGAIFDWVDVELIQKAAQSYPKITFSLVGPIQNTIDKVSLKKLPNVVLHGIQDYNELPKFIMEFDVCLIPFKISQLTMSVNPVKLYEYFASGRPVVSTALPEVLPYLPYAYIGNTHQEFISLIGRALEEDNIEWVRIRKKIAADNSWESKVIEMEKVLKNLVI